MADVNGGSSISCRVKWFDPTRGFGFLIPDTDGPDILLHANQLRSVGLETVTNSDRLDVVAKVVNGRWQTQSITAIFIDQHAPVPQITQAKAMLPEDLDALSFKPAKVKWFDCKKGFGFANTFGSTDDVFIHIEVLRACGLASLEVDEAVALRIVEGKHGLLAVQIGQWSFPSSRQDESKSVAAPAP